MADLPSLPPLDDAEDVVLVVPPPPAVASTTSTATFDKERWPQMTTLMRDHGNTVLRILNACDDCEVTREANASDSNNVKANQWVRLHDHLFGGREDGTRGLITEFPVIALPSKLKKKIIQIWQHGLAPDKVSVDVHRMCTRQWKEYEDTRKALAESSKAEKEKHAELVEKMRSYEDSVGALPPGAKASLPPGAKPDEGGGRLNHSTNLNNRQPASFAYANLSRSSLSVQGTRQSPTEMSISTPAPGNSASSANATGINSAALAGLNKMQNNFEELMNRVLPAASNPTTTSPPSDLTADAHDSQGRMSKKKRKLHNKINNAKKKKVELMEQLTFLEPMKETEVSWYMNIKNRYAKLSLSILDMMDELDEAEEDDDD